ncbi:murein L,D-transpeptidase [Methylocapsa sp. S129]|uniref:L,D-transpeptidase family protein n=1 Tax=Methylocapsa sp. S129 TaxID=1641869 RepID=UPI00131D30E5|nr:L,D-transpeptidase family protein [Methylocapsa sp. S129]
MALRLISTGGFLAFALVWAGAAVAEDVSSPAPAAPAQSAPSAPAPAAAAPSPAVTPAPALTPAPIPAVPGGAALPIPADVGATPPIEPPKIETPKPKKIVHVAPPRETALSDSPTPTFQPDTFFATAKASERYAAIADAGGWPRVPGPLRAGTKGASVAILRQRLAAEGDLDSAKAAEGPSSAVWDEDVTAAVKHFQSRMGLRQTGAVAGATLTAMNVPAATRFKQLASSAQRLAGVNFPFGDRYVVVNLPSTSVEAIENGRVVHHYVAIVGGVEHQSPEISAKISVINLNPTWTVPTSIIKKEIIPKMQRDPGYLTRAKIRILDGAGNVVDPKSVDWNSQRAVNYTLRQDSGASNSLGAIRIGMPNKLAVYMHDTPSKGLFGADYRFLSHGCVRVQGVYDLAQWLLEGTPAGNGVWDKEALLAKIKDGAREDIKLAKIVPVIWVYLTGWANGDGLVSFRDDVYGIDTVGEATANAAPLTAAPAVNPEPTPAR